MPSPSGFHQKLGFQKSSQVSTFSSAFSQLLQSARKMTELNISRIIITRKVTNVYRQILKFCTTTASFHHDLKFLECLGSNPIRRFLGVRTIVSRFVKHQMLR